MPRGADFDLAAALGRRGFTPAARDAPALAALVVDGDDKLASRASAALAALGDAGRAAVIARLDEVDEAGRARLVGVLGALAIAGDGEARARVIAASRDPASRVRRAAAHALGKLRGDDARAAVLARWDAGDATPDERRALAEALGKLGGDDALARLRALEPGDDAELARRRDRALLMVERDASRDAASTIVADVPPPAPVTLRLGCRAGLEPVLAEELAALGLAREARDDRARSRAPADDQRAASAGPGVALTLAAPLSTLFASRLWASLAIEWPLPAGELAPAITRAMTDPALRALLRAWTRGPIRWRLGFAHGHKRAVIWRVARDVTAAAPELINDPTATTWDVTVDDTSRTLAIAPRRLDDPRFAWRVAEVPAASHPTVAAALAWVAEARPDDRVWDPFCGAGGELIERARRGPARALAGSDLDPAALDAARANLAAAGLDATLARADARGHAPGPVELILTNPPLGSRVQVDAAALLCDALPHLARQLAPGGRLVWITPAPRRTTPVAERLGLIRRRALAVDLGGVRGQLERWDRA